MLHQVLALTVRSLREDTRSVRSHLLRFAFVLFVFALLLSVQQEFRTRSAPGLWLFQYLCWANFALITIGGLSVFATAITEEKEEGTLGLLRMAGISPVSLLLGKSTTRLLTALLILAVQFPFTLLAITLGGVLWNQILAVYVELAAWLIVVANIGLMASVMCARSSSAGSLSGFAMAFWLIIVPLLYALAMALNREFGGIFAWLLEPFEWGFHANAVNRLNVILTTGVSDDIWTWGVTGQLLVALGLFLLATFTFDWFTRDNPVLAPTRWWIPKRRTRRTGPVAAPAASGVPGKPSNPFFFPGLSPVPAWSNALLWKDFHFLSGGYITAGFKLIGYGAIVLLFLVFMLFVEIRSPNPEQLIRTAGGTALAIGLLGGAVELGIIASRVFWEETRWNTWPALVMLPRSLAYVCWSKVGGMALSVVPALLWSGLGFLINVDQMLRWGPDVDDFLMALTFGTAYYVLFLHVTAYVSLWVKWGALPLSFVLLFIVGPMLIACCGGVFAGGSDEGLFIGLAFIMALASAGLHVAIGYRLAELAER